MNNKDNIISYKISFFIIVFFIIFLITNILYDIILKKNEIIIFLQFFINICKYNNFILLLGKDNNIILFPNLISFSFYMRIILLSFYIYYL